MKIKDVMEQTGLTDKAIRLYINNGLAAPSIEENYSGRKSIDFSEADVERLKNIALLRKAGFSIADIKACLTDENNINEIVCRFMDEKEKDIQRDAEIVNILKRIATENLTFEKLCKALDETEIDKEIPAEDMHVSKKERVFRKVFKGFAISNLVISILVVIAYLVMINIDYRYPTLENMWYIAYAVTYGGFVIVAALSVWIIRLCSGKSMPMHKIVKIGVSSLLSFILLVWSVFISFFGTISLIYTVTPSKTEKTENYLALDNFNVNNQLLVEDGIRDLFPSIIPSIAENVKYYYRYCCPFLAYEFDVFAEWVLPDGDFEKEVNSKQLYGLKEKTELMTDENENLLWHVKSEEEIFVEKGDWKLIYFADSESAGKLYEDGGYIMSIFAYNENTNTVRYIVSTSDYGGREPYYLSLEW